MDKIFNNKFNRVQINIAATLFTKNGDFVKNKITQKIEPAEDEKELNQYALEFKEWPVPEKYLDKGLSEMCLAVKKSMRDAGLLR